MSKPHPVVGYNVQPVECAVLGAEAGRVLEGEVMVQQEMRFHRDLSSFLQASLCGEEGRKYKLLNQSLVVRAAEGHSPQSLGAWRQGSLLPRISQFLCLSHLHIYPLSWMVGTC